MTIRETTTIFHGTPNVGKLFRAFWGVLGAWIAARRYNALDFRQVAEGEITPEMQASIELIRNAPDEDFVNI